MIKVNHLHKYFNRFKRNEIHVLNDINLEFPEKGLVVLLGPSGSGKTTLLNVLGGLDKVQSGTIDFDHTQIEGYDAGTWEKIRNEAVGYVFQNYNLLPELSVFDNIAFVLKMIGIQDPQVIEERVHYILNALNMYPFRKKRALQLSGGQQQRVAIARALVKNPRIIIADEPTGNLDSKNTLEIMNIIKQISMEKLVVLVTHEKDIANFYGDRIIELKDGRIISDTDNEINHEHQFGTDDIIYLKDLNQVINEGKTELNVALYKDHQDEEEPISVRLIVKNKTLYLDVNSPYKKIKLLDKNAGVTIKDEHFVKKTRAEMIETSFDVSKLDNKNVHRQPKILVSIKQILWMALIKVAKTSRKGKLMLFSFFVAGLVIAFTLSFLASSIIIEPEKNMIIGKDYISLYKYYNGDSITYDDLMSFKDEDDNSFKINSFGSQLPLVFENTPFQSYDYIYARIDYLKDFKKSDLTHGDLPSNPQGVLVSRTLAERIVNSSLGQNMGIWSIRHLLQEKLKYGSQTIEITGILDIEQQLIFFDPLMAAYAYDINRSPNSIIGYELFIDDIEIVEGNYPTENQVLVSKEHYDRFYASNVQPFPKYLSNLPYEVSGIYESTFELPNFLSTYELQEKLRLENEYNIFIRTSDKQTLIEALTQAYPNHEINDIYDLALMSARAQRDIVLYSSLGTAGFIIGFALLGFYFIIRSSLISRIYEISVYRALGVRKKEIFRSFIIEIIVLTSLSTLIGYVLASIAISKLQDGLLGTLQLFKITPLSFIAGLIIMYSINIIAGLFPVYLLLRKTPAQILAQYDI